MTAITFDTLKLAQRLRDKAKYTPEQAENTASVLSETLSEWGELQELATKADINALKVDINTLRTDLKAEMAELKAELIKWVVGMSFAQVAMLVTVFKVLH